MKKIFGICALAMIAAVMSCSNQPAETKKEVIVVPVNVEKKEPVIIQEPPKPTTVTLDKNGVKVETRKVKVAVKPN